MGNSYHHLTNPTHYLDASPELKEMSTRVLRGEDSTNFVIALRQKQKRTL